MTTTVKGIYRNGKIELLEPPPTDKEVRVLVTFVEAQDNARESAPKSMLRYGMFPDLADVPDELFKAAEWHGESELKKLEDEPEDGR